MGRIQRKPKSKVPTRSCGDESLQESKPPHIGGATRPPVLAKLGMKYEVRMKNPFWAFLFVASYIFLYWIKPCQNKTNKY